MLDVILRVRAQKVSDANLLIGIDTAVVLLLPQLIFQDIGICRLNGLSCLSLVELNNLGSGLLALVLVFLDIPCQGLPLIGVIEFSRKFDTYRGVPVYLPLCQQRIDDMTQAKKRTHRHRVAEAADPWRTELVDPFRHTGVSLHHGGVIKLVGLLFGDFILCYQIVFYTPLCGPVVQFVAVSASNGLQDPIDNLWPVGLLLPDISRHNFP